jgi:transposase
MYCEGYNRDEIASRLHVGTHRILAVLSFWKAHRVMLPRRQMGRPTKCIQEVVDFVEVRTLQEAGLGNASLAREVFDRCHFSLSPGTVRRIRKQLKFEFRAPRHTQSLTDVNIADRMKFCEEMLKWRDDQLQSICFSDESRVVLGDDKQWVWYRRGEDNPSACFQTAKYPQGVMVFAVIGVGYKSKLLIVDGTINTQKYIENCHNLGFIHDLDQKHGCFGWTFQQDDAPCHMSQESLDWLEESADVLSGWPANSPDLSPIELCWAILKKAVSAEHPDTLPRLREVLHDAWAGIRQSSIDKLCLSFKNRLMLCKDRGGQSISNDLWIMCDMECLGRYGTQHEPLRLPWTDEEDQMLIHLHAVRGSNWQQLAKYFTNREPNQLKNRWHSVLKKREETKIMDTEYQMAMRRDAWTLCDTLKGTYPMQKNHPGILIPRRCCILKPPFQ